MKKILFGGLALVVVLVAAILIVPGFIDWNAYKSEITERAQAATGRRLDITGDLSLTLLPAPALSVEGLALQSIAGAREPVMVALQAAEARVALWPLLRGEVQVSEVRLVKPVITLERLADGRANWELGEAQGVGQSAGAGAAATEDGEDGGSADFRLDRLLIEDGTLVFHDAASGFTERLEGIDAKLSAGSLAGPFSAGGKLGARGLGLAFDARIGTLKTAQAVPLKLALEVAGAKAKMTLTGSLSQPDANATLKAKLELGGPDLAQLMRLAHQAAGIAPPPLALNQPFSLKTALSASSSELALNEIQLNLGSSTINGGANISFAETLGFDVALNANRFDLDALLAGMAAGGSDNGKAAENKATENKNPANAGGGGFAIPANLAGSLNLGIEAVSYRGSIIRQAQLEAAVAKGVVTLGRAAVLLPGGSDAALSGRLSAVKGQPRFEGTLQAASDNLRALLDWLAVEVGPVPNDRLRKFTLLTRLRATPQLIEITSLDSRLDTTRLSGTAAYAVRARPSFGVDINIDRLNLDAYLPLPPAGQADSAKAQAKTKEKAPEGPEASPLALLDKFDTNLKLQLGHLTYNNVAARGIALDVGLLGGNLKVRRARVKDLAGAALQLSGSASNLARKIAAKGKVKVTAKNPSGLFRLAGVNLPFPAERLGRVALDGTIGGKAGHLDLDLKLQAGRNRLGAKGSLIDPVLDPKVDLTLNLANPSHSNLVRLFDPAFKPAGKGLDAAIDVSGKVAGSLDGLKLELSVGLAKARIKARGSVQPLKAGFKLALNAKAGDALRFLRRLGVDYQPALKPFGSLALAFDLAGDAAAMQISKLKGGFGPLRLEGKAAARLAGAKPFVSADLRTSEILVDLFLPPQSKAKKGGAASAGGAKGAAQRWSRDPIEVAFLNDFDAELQLAAPGIGYGSYHFAKPQVKALVKDGVLDIKSLTGQLFDGNVALSARLDGRKVAATSLAIDVKGGNLKKALLAAAGIDVATGTFGLDGSFQARGASQLEMIRSLGGQASFGAEQGIVSGFDLKALSDRLKELDRGGDFLRLIQTSMKGGQTRFSRVGGTAKIDKGVARTDDLRAELEAGEGTGRGSVDLPRWLIDAFGEFRLSEHPKAPPVGLVLRGPLDAPQRDIKSRKLEAYVSRRVGKTLLRKFGGSKGGKLGGALDSVLGGAKPAQTQQQPQNQNQTQPQSQPQPEQKLKPEDLIKGLFKKLKR